MFREPDQEKTDPQALSEEPVEIPIPEPPPAPELHPFYQRLKDEGRFAPYTAGYTEEQLRPVDKLVSDYCAVLFDWKDAVFEKLKDPHFKEKLFRYREQHRDRMSQEDKGKDRG